MTGTVVTERLPVVYIDPEARPSSDLLAHFGDQGMDIHWICDYREFDPRRGDEGYLAVIVDMSSSDPKDFQQRILEARSLNLAAPSVAIVPPESGLIMNPMKSAGFIHHYLERPIDQEVLVREVLGLIHKFREKDLDGDTESGIEESEGILAGLAALSGREQVDPGELFADLVDQPGTGQPGAAPGQWQLLSSTRANSAHEYRSMRAAPIEVDRRRDVEELQNYVLEEHVATGGMAELFKARLRGAEGFTRTVAVKRILPMRADDEDFVAMFIDEARLASSLDHPNIVRTLDFGKCKTSSGKDTYFIALDYVEGRDLNWVLKRLRERGLCLPEPIAAYIASKVASALHYLHTRKDPKTGEPMGFVHRDVSPHNIMLSKQGEVIIVDFGVIQAAQKINQTLDGNLKGKLVYMSPEQASGEELDGRSDIFALGLVLFETLAMRKAYARNAAPGGKAVDLQILKLAQQGNVPSLKDHNPFVSSGMESILSKATQKKPGNRFPDAQAMEKALKNFVRSMPDRVEETDLAEFIGALLEKDQSVLTNLIHSRYPSASNYASWLGQDTSVHASPVKPAAPDAAPVARFGHRVLVLGIVLVAALGTLLFALWNGLRAVR